MPFCKYYDAIVYSLLFAYFFQQQLLQIQKIVSQYMLYGILKEYT